MKTQISRKAPCTLLYPKLLREPHGGPSKGAVWRSNSFCGSKSSCEGADPFCHRNRILETPASIVVLGEWLPDPCYLSLVPSGFVPGGLDPEAVEGPKPKP